jgi:hypothetical protein
MIFVEEACVLHVSAGCLGVDQSRRPVSEITTELWMTRKHKFQQPQLWMPPVAPVGVELSAPQRRELTAALADLLWQFASLSTETETEKPPRNTEAI